MELQHLLIKIPVTGPLGLDPAKVVDVFHQWVAAQSVPGVLLVDVAELLHVPDGPGVVAVGHEADFALDHTGGAWGVVYRRKSVLPGTDCDRIAEALGSAGQAGVRLEEAFPGQIKFSRTEFDLIVNDRGIAPNDPATYAWAVPVIEAALRAILGHSDFQLARHDRDRRKRFGIGIRSARPFALTAEAAAH